MLDKPKATHTLGLELTRASIKGAQLTLNKGKPALVQVFDMPTDVEHEETSERASPLDLTEEGRQLYEVIDKHLVVTSLPTKQVLIRPLEVKLTKQRDVDAVLPFQAEPILPYAPEDAQLDRVILSKNQDATQLSLLASKNDYLEDHLAIWQSLHIEPEVITCTPAALATFAAHFFPSDTPYFILHLGATETACLLIKDNKLIAAHPSKDTDLEVTKTFYSLGKQIQEKPTTILVTGDRATENKLAATLCAKLNLPLSTPKTTPAFPISEAQLQKYAAVIGMALSGLPKIRNDINFRQDEFIYPNPWKRLKKPLATYLISALLLAMAFFLFGNAYTKYQEDQLKTSFVELVSYMHKPYEEFEQEYAKKFPSDIENPAELSKDVKKLTFTGLENRVNQLEKLIQTRPESFPLQPHVPQVSDVLAWISTHPNVVAKNEETGEINPLLLIESFHYTMVKRPEKSRKQDKYQVKIDLEFTAFEPKYAREFHDALIAPNDIVDPKIEVKWNASQGKYRASFFLQDRTVYSTIKGKN